MNIIKATGELTKKEIYAMTRGRAQSFKDCIGEQIEPAKWMLYTEQNSKGEDVEILSVMDPDGEVCTTTSPTFKDEFLYIAELMDGEQYVIESYNGTSKAGRTFISCTLLV